TAARQATAAALSGQLDDALRIADRLVSSDRSVAAVAATALVHRGQLARASTLYRWSGAHAFAALSAAATGSASELTMPEPDGPPSLLDGASALMAKGLRESLSGSPISAMSAFAQANNLLEPSGRTQLLPDSPAALAALVGLHCGEFGIGESMVDRALVARVGGPLLSRRHTLLKAWIHMTRGHTAHAAELLAAPKGDGPLEPRDLLFAVGIEVGLARRNSDLPALGRAWERAREALIRHPVDLFTLLPLGELAIAAARLGEADRIGVHVREADQLLEALGRPALWATPWHWSRLHAAIVMEDTPSADEHMKALASSAHLRFGAVLATAAECWMELLRGTVDPIRVESAARALHEIGLSWDGARLAGQAAIRTSDRRAMTALLDCARVLQGRPTVQKGQAPEPVAVRVDDSGRLSEREQEVAQLVLAGLTYKQVGDQLFISAKTVEHHVARMRQRLNCSSRSELLARLRAMTSTATGTPIPAQRRATP
ncbi:helix-turn-helix transcriptional regulator, partial [Allorhizocola rhizosphaerae]|uniref:helix-turn-helix transcriptional regulator n=1 Tax=Allorhizocola rhizosphaerae TaxID=1872709 RepID=UPI0013C36F03